MEVEGLRVVALLCVLMVFLVPSAAADGNGNPGNNGNNGGGHGGNNSGNGSNGNHGHGDQGQEEGDENELTLEGTIDETTASLEWIFTGDEASLAGFEIYRSVNEGARELVATVGADDRSYSEPLPTGPAGSSGSYTYSTESKMMDGQSSSDSVTMLLVGCDWISVSPFGNPPVLFHNECSPFQSRFF